MKRILFILLVFPVIIFADEYEYSLQDYNSTSPTYGTDVWNPEYSGYITMHYFSSQGWAGWTNTFGQLSNFQEELREDDGYENIVIIAVGQSNISGFNINFTSNSDLPLVMDQYPTLPIRDQFAPYGQHKQLVFIDYDGIMKPALDYVLSTQVTSGKTICANWELWIWRRLCKQNNNTNE